MAVVAPKTVAKTAAEAMRIASAASLRESDFNNGTSVRRGLSDVPTGRSVLVGSAIQLKWGLPGFNQVISIDLSPGLSHSERL